MSDGEELPVLSSDAPIECLGYWLSVDFYPPIKLGRSDGLSFAQEIADWVEPEDVQLEPSEWTILGGSICEGVTVRVLKQSLSVSVMGPSNRLEWYEHRFNEVLKAFTRVFSPRVALRSNVIVRNLIDLGENDARVFIGGHLMALHPSKLDPIGRPLHILGVRLFFPPYEESKSSDVDWSVNVRVESWIQDPKQLFLEADADWENSSEWRDGFADEVIQRIGTVSEFVSTRLLEFLRQPSWPDDEEYDGDEN